jgi:beta-glucosidase
MIFRESFIDRPSDRHRNVIRAAAAVVAFAACATTIPSQTVPTSQPAYLDPSLPVASRVDDLISRLTLDEKVGQLQDVAPAIPRLHIPAYTWGNEGLHGDAYSGYATLFPQTIGMAATFDEPLVHGMGDVIATEARAKYNQAGNTGEHGRFHGITFWAPNINIFRDPRWGRGQETYGEDPYLTSRMAVAYITGLQGDDPRYLKALAGPKHFDAHSGPEGERHQWDTVVSARDLEDTYLPAFRAAVEEAHAGSVMCSYNRINGIPACANPWLLTETLRNQWHFTGFVISDCGAVGDLSQSQHYASDVTHASALAVRAGMDSSCGWVPDGQREEYSYLLEAAQAGLVNTAEIDQALRRVLTLRFRLGMFDPDDLVPFSRIPASLIDSPDHAALALRAARESIVLLKNDDHFLPLHHVKTIAVIGPSADLTRTLEGNYNATPLYPITPLMGMQQRFHGRAQIFYAQGSQLTAGMPVVIESIALHPDADSAQNGLRGEYFNNPDFAGQPVVTRVDRTINFNWTGASPVPGLAVDNYSVRWTGVFTPIAPGDYMLGAKVRGCAKCGREFVRLYLDGRLLVSQDQDVVQRVHFTDRRAHIIRLEYEHRFIPTHHLINAGVDLLWEPPADALREEALAEVRKADVTVAFVGLSPELEGEELPVKLDGFLSGDRTSLALPAAQESLLEAAAATGKPLVVVLMSGSAVAMPFAQQHARAILEAWYPGESGGVAIAETLAGDNNPAGRLPVTFYTGIDQLPPFADYSMANRTYRYFHGQPEFGFGYGLSYSSFRYSNLRLSSSQLTPGSALDATVQVRNTSSIPGDEVVELYLVPPAAPGNPLRRLVAFKRIHLDAGQQQSVQFTLPAASAQIVQADGTRALVPGRYRLIAAGAQPQDASSSAEVCFVIP